VLPRCFLLHGHVLARRDEPRAKEFVASRDDERGALILSTFAGASHELSDALLVNPTTCRSSPTSSIMPWRCPKRNRLPPWGACVTRCASTISTGGRRIFIRSHRDSH